MKVRFVFGVILIGLINFTTTAYGQPAFDGFNSNKGPSSATTAVTREAETKQAGGITNDPPYINSSQQSPAAEVKFLSTPEFALSLMVSVILLIALSMQFFLLRNPKINPDNVLRIFSINLILMGSMFFISAGFDASQIAPALGLFGIIAGYLLGKSDKRVSEKTEKKESEENE